MDILLRQAELNRKFRLGLREKIKNVKDKDMAEFKRKWKSILHSKV